MRIVRAIVVAVLAVPASYAQDAPSHRGRSRDVAPKPGDTVAIRVPVSEPSRSLLTSVTFPDGLDHIVSGWDEKDLSVERAGNRLFLKLLSKASGDLVVTTAEGEEYRLHILAAAASEEFDASVVVKKPEAARGPAERRGRNASGALELVKAMRLGEVPPDATVRRAGGERLLESEDLDAALLWLYETAGFRGLVIALTNKSASNAYQIDASRLAAERLVVSASRETVLGPGRSTRLYLVFWK